MLQKRHPVLSQASLLLLFLFLFFPVLAQKSVKPALADLDAYFAQALKDWKVPGMAIAIVKNDSVILAKGYGVLNVKTGGPVNSSTIFGIASNTKAFTAAALALLADEGKLNWDDPVTKYLPYFSLYNPYVTQNLTIRDLLSHRVGLATFSGDLLWYNTTYSREEILRRARYLEPVYSFRDGFGYSNIMFIAAGQIIENLSGQSWESFIKQHFFGPLGMNQSYTSVNELAGQPNVASPHGNDANGKPYATSFMAWDNWNPAAGIFTSVNQHAQWLRLQLNQGQYQGKRIFSEEASRIMWSAQQPIAISKQNEKILPSTHFTATGLGWFLSDYQGRKLVYHGGGHEGMNSRVVLVPEENLGLVIFTNSMSNIMTPLAYKAIDKPLGIPDGRDWSQVYLAASKARTKAAPKVAAAKSGKFKPNLPLTAYTGRYTSQLYGDATITLVKNQLELNLLPAPTLGGKLTHAQHDIFDLTWKNNYALLTPTKVRFIIGPSGAIEQMRLDANNPDFIFAELDFRKVPE